MFTFFGANGFLHFLHASPPASPYALQFFTAVSTSHFIVLVFTVQLISGISLLVDYFVPLALVALAAVLVNILNYHITMDMSSVPPALVATVLWIIAAQNYRGNFRGLLARKAESPTA